MVGTGTRAGLSINTGAGTVVSQASFAASALLLSFDYEDLEDLPLENCFRPSLWGMHTAHSELCSCTVGVCRSVLEGDSACARSPCSRVRPMHSAQRLCTTVTWVIGTQDPGANTSSLVTLSDFFLLLEPEVWWPFTGVHAVNSLLNSGLEDVFSGIRHDLHGLL